MKPIYFIFLLCITAFSCSRENKNQSATICKVANGNVVCSDSSQASQLTPNPIIIPDSVTEYKDTSYVTFSLKTKDIPLKKISEVQSPGKRFLNNVKLTVKTGVLGRKIDKIKNPAFTKARPTVKLAGYPVFKKIGPLKHNENGLYDIQHIDERAQDICWSKDGSAWIASGIEISHIQGDYMESYSAAQGALTAATNVKIDNLGNVWSAYDGVSYFDGKYFYTFLKKEGFTNNGVYIMFKDSKGQMWFGTRGDGIYCYNGKGFLHYGRKQGLRVIGVSAIEEDKKGNMWFGTEGGGLLKFDGKSFVNYSTVDGMPSTYVYAIYAAPDGKIWCGHYLAGISMLSHDTLTVYDFGSQMGSPVFSLMGIEGNKLLIGTIGSGLLLFDGEKFEQINKEAGMNETVIMKLARDPDKNIWALGARMNRLRLSEFKYIPIAATQGVFNIAPDKRLFLNLEKYTYLEKDKAITYSGIGFKTNGTAKDDKDRLWFANWCEGIGILEREKIKSVLINGKSNWGCFASVGNGVNGDIWFTSWTYGLMRLKNEKLTAYGENPAMVDLGGLNTSFCDARGNMWFGSSNSGLVKYDGKYFYRFPLLDSIVRKNGAIGINAITADANGIIFISYLGAGIVTYDGKHFNLHNDGDLKIGTGADITETGVQEFMKADRKGRIWAILNGKLTCIQNGKRTQIGPADGLLFTPVSYSFDDDGNMWFSNEEMTGLVNVEHLLEVKKTPVVSITKLNIFQQEIDYRSLLDSIKKRKNWIMPEINVNLGKIKFDTIQNFSLLPNNIVFPYNVNQIALVYGTTDLNIQGNVLFSYQLVGYDKTWSLPTDERIANYRKLDPGTYTFQVKSKLLNGDFGKISSYSFKITPPWWKTWWARMGYGLIVLMFILLYNRWRVASFKRRQKELETEVEVATSEIRKQKDEAETQRAKAEKSEQFKQQFLANMSHEIRTPMNAVMGMTSLVLDTPLAEKQKFYMEGIKKSSDNLLHIINDILDLSKIEAGKMELEQIDFSITGLIDQVKQTLNHRADEKGLELITMIKSDVSDIVIGDPVRLNQVLINLAGNAIKFTEKGSVSIEVTKEEEGVRFAIVDTGIGIPEDKLQTVFESFSQANASDTRKYGGTGLGLSISRQLVGMMGGNIAIKSKEGYGTTFSFFVQFEKGSAERLEQRTALEQSVDGSILDGLKILIADDNEYNRIVARDTLVSKANVEIYEATNGQEAIDLVGKMQFDLILMDVQMPMMNGFDATRYIRANFDSPAKDTPIIALTASVLRTDLDKCKEAGMDSYIPKPFTTQQLITGIAQVLNIALKAKKETKPNDQKMEPAGVTDMAYLYKFCEGDNIRMKKYISMFTSTAPGLIEKINTAIAISDFDEIANQVHGFKTKWIMMGMKETKDIAIRLEHLCRDGSEEELIKETIGILSGKIELALDELSE
jgi:signal transduction histidine kinase/AmiR/NasT family two-component response regulator/streptogramin lyase